MSHHTKNNPSKRPSNRAPNHASSSPANKPGHSDVTAAAHKPPTIESAIKEVEVGATHLAQAVNAEVHTRTSEAVGQIKQTLARAEEKVEKLVEQIPGVGPDAAQKLHALTHDDATRPSH
jgi:hypothetical protein